MQSDLLKFCGIFYKVLKIVCIMTVINNGFSVRTCGCRFRFFFSGVGNERLQIPGIFLENCILFYSLYNVTIISTQTTGESKNR